MIVCVAICYLTLVEAADGMNVPDADSSVVVLAAAAVAVGFGIAYDKARARLSTWRQECRLGFPRNENRRETPLLASKSVIESASADADSLRQRHREDEARERQQASGETMTGIYAAWSLIRQRGQHLRKKVTMTATPRYVLRSSYTHMYADTYATHTVIRAPLYMYIYIDHIIYRRKGSTWKKRALEASEDSRRVNANSTQSSIHIPQPWLGQSCSRVSASVYEYPRTSDRCCASLLIE